MACRLIVGKSTFGHADSEASPLVDGKPKQSELIQRMITD